MFTWPQTIVLLITFGVLAWLGYRLWNTPDPRYRLVEQYKEALSTLSAWKDDEPDPLPTPRNNVTVIPAEKNDDLLGGHLAE